MSKNNIAKISIIFLLLLLFLKVDFRLKTEIECCNDDHDYYMHSETIAIDFDLNYSNQLLGNETRRFNVDGYIAPQGFIGSGLLSAPFLLIGHVTKDGQLAGPKLVEHMVDTVLYFEGEKTNQLRLDLISEELEELKNAMASKDLLEVADALTDILYVTYGAGHAFGINLDKCFDEVQNSNMSKLGSDGKPIYNESGKVMKGPDYFKPDLSKYLS